MGKGTPPIPEQSFKLKIKIMKNHKLRLISFRQNKSKPLYCHKKYPQTRKNNR
jgi:hypothetical protein